ncbi:MAG: DNA primase [Clostridia bacterium]|nr:DNA primase [Clostridia bacterium]
MNISEEFIAELKEKNDIEEIISDYVPLTRKGKNLMGICPFHAERTPSFCVYPANGSFYCFGCGAGGDVITFLRLIEHYDYIETVKFLAERAGMNFEVNEEEDESHKKKLLIYKINREAARFYHKCLFAPEGEEALSYLKKRGISLKTIKHFGLGYSPKSRFALIDYLNKKGYNSEDAVLANLAFKTRNLKEKDRFCNRLMFPIIDVRGNVIAFGARTMGGDIPKYINTSDTPVFKKSNNLFALNFAKNSGMESFILTEGYMDVVSLNQAGFQNAVAGLGTALTQNQVKLISRYTDSVLVTYDSDEAGQKAAAKAITMLKDSGINVKVITIPKGKDPDEFLRTQGKDGAVRFKNLIEKSENDTEYRLSKAKKMYDSGSDEDKINYLTNAARILSSCQNPIEREVYATRLSLEMGINKSALIMQIEKFMKQNLKKHKKQEFKNLEKITSALNDKINPEKKENLRAAVAEESLISYIINNVDKASDIFLRVNADDIITNFNRRVFECVKSIIAEGKTPDITSISAKGDFNFEEIGRITKIICSYNSQLVNQKTVDEYINIIFDENKKIKVKNVNELSEFKVKEYIETLKNDKK